MSSDEIDDAAPLEAVKWSFVRRRAVGLFLAHGYREVAPPPLELRGTHLLARRAAAWPVGDDLELRADPIISLAQLYARSRRSDDEHAPAPLTRWVLSDIVFDPGASGPHRYPAWHAIASGLFGVPGSGAELETALLAQRIATDLALREPLLRVSCAGVAPGLARELRTALAELQVAFIEQPANETSAEAGFSFELVAQPPEGDPIVVARGRRHDGLLSALGEPAAPAFGMVMSVRRAATCAPGDADTYEPAAEVFFLAVDPAARLRALAAAGRERARGLRIEVELRDLPREAQLARAAGIRARVIVEFSEHADRVGFHFAGEADLREVPLAELSSALRRILR